MTFRLPVVFSLILLLLFAGCAKARIVVYPATPYDSMGTLEEHVVSVQYNIVVRILTLGLLRKPSYADLTKELREKLESQAVHKYGADAVSNIQYWPDLTTDATVDYLYARGEMIRYKKFPPETESTSPASPQTIPAPQ